VSKNYQNDKRNIVKFHLELPSKRKKRHCWSM